MQKKSGYAKAEILIASRVKARGKARDHTVSVSTTSSYRVEAIWQESQTMAPPTGSRPHLNDLLQKNHELEHAVADLRHQITQSSAKWAEERKTLAVGCDALMASFTKFRARLDDHPLDRGDSEEGVDEQNPDLDAGGLGEERSEAGNGLPKTVTEKDRGSPATEMLYERCRVLAEELREKEVELGESRKKCDATEEELQRVQRSLDDQSEQLRAALASSKADTNNRLSPEHTFDDTSAQDNPAEMVLKEKLELAIQEMRSFSQHAFDRRRIARTTPGRETELQPQEHDPAKMELKDTLEKLDLANQEIRRLKQLLQEWKTYAFKWKRIAQTSPGREAELQLRELEPGTGQSQSAGPSSSTQSSTPHTDTNANNSNSIALRIPTHCIGKEAETSVPQEGQQQNVTSSEQAPASPLTVVDSAPPISNNAPANPAEFEVCIHTCNPFPCRNDSRSFLWPRKLSSLPRHVLSTKKHHRCTPECPGHRFLNMPLAEAMKEPRQAKCRRPTEAELAVAAEESRDNPSSEPSGEKVVKFETETRSEGSRESEQPDELDGGSTRPEASRGRERERSSQMNTPLTVLGKRLRSPRTTDGEESQRSRRLRPRISFVTKP